MQTSSRVFITCAAVVAVGAAVALSAAPARAARSNEPVRPRHHAATRKMLRMKVLGLSRVRGNYVVVLHRAGVAKKLPIWIGPRQARAIAIKHAKVATPRPMTHDLLQRIIKALGARIERVEVSDLRNNTFIGRLVLRAAGGKLRTIDARPSDLIVLGVANGLPIYVAKHVLDQAGTIIPSGRGVPGGKAAPAKLKKP